MSYQIFGRAIKNEYLALGTIISTAVIAISSTGGKKAEAHQPGGSTIKEKIEKAKEAIPFSAGSSDEEQFIKKFVEDEEKKMKH